MRGEGRRRDERREESRGDRRRGGFIPHNHSCNLNVWKPIYAQCVGQVRVWF